MKNDTHTQHTSIRANFALPEGPLNDYSFGRKRLHAVKTIAAFLALDVIAFAAEPTAPAASVAPAATAAVTAPASAGGVRGVILLPNGDPAAGVLVSIRETGQSAETNSDGEFEFPRVAAPNLYTLVASADGFRPLHQTGVYSKPDEMVTLGGQRLRKAAGSDLKPEVVAAELPTKLNRYEVNESKLTPYMAANLDIKRTVDDVQPYFVFDAKTIELSGARNIEEFFKQRLTVNAVTRLSSEVNDGIAMAAETQATSGNRSQVDLLGLGVGGATGNDGTTKTLILVDGRPMAGVNIKGKEMQADLNGIPLTAIERIEVLPTSAGAIYGGGAIGGVVNVILKQKYRGGDVRVSYSNIWDVDAPTRSVSFSYGLGLEGGRTNVMFTASWTDAQPMLLADRAYILQRNLDTLKQNSPTFLFSTASPWIGSVPNIASNDGVANLVLKDGRSLNSPRTMIPAGTAPNLSLAELSNLVLANAGKWNLDLPLNTRYPNGLLRRFGSTPETYSVRGAVNRRMNSWLTADVAYTFSSNSSETISNPASSFRLSASSPANPFNQTIAIEVADNTDVPLRTRSISNLFVAGLTAKLPASWNARLDYSWAHTSYRYSFYTLDTTAINLAASNGTIKLFTDTLLNPIPWATYHTIVGYDGGNDVHRVALRANGPLPSLPWGEPRLVGGIDYAFTKSPDNKVVTELPITTDSSNIATYYASKTRGARGYAELAVPLIKTGWLPGLYSLETQIVGSYNYSQILGGTQSETTFHRRATPTTTYVGPTDNGKPFRKWASNSTDNYTFGLKYEPFRGLVFRGSQATAFLPPTGAQLVKNLTPNSFLSQVTDPKNNNNKVSVQTISGGNPDLKPQNSRSRNLGAIWEPKWKLLSGFRFNLEYYEVNQFDSISSLSTQQIVNMESLYPGRVTRDSNGLITLVDNSLLNVYRRTTSGMTGGVNYSRATRLGQFAISASATRVVRIANQFSLTSPNFDYVGIPSEGGAIRYKGNGTVAWEGRRWRAAWTTTYYDSYRQFGSPGGPYDSLNPGQTLGRFYRTAGGREEVPAQMFHDVNIGYRFGTRPASGTGRWAKFANEALKNVSVSVAVNNVFGTEPEFDPYYGGLYLSPVGDVRLRTYRLSLTKTF